jgi:hypothetical protein
MTVAEPSYSGLPVTPAVTPKQPSLPNTSRQQNYGQVYGQTLHASGIMKCTATKSCAKPGSPAGLLNSRAVAPAVTPLSCRARACLRMKFISSGSLAAAARANRSSSNSTTFWKASLQMDSERQEQNDKSKQAAAATAVVGRRRRSQGRSSEAQAAGIHVFWILLG